MATIQYICPECQAASTAADDALVIRCQHCGQQFFRAVESENSTADESALREQAASQNELSGLHIRQVTVHRRALIRARSYCIIGVAACAVVVVQIMYMMRGLLHSRMARNPGRIDWMIAGAAVLILGLVWGMIHLARRVGSFTRELCKPIQNEPTAPPEFTNLSDGSQYIANLEEIGPP